jgi:hypothetical protein
MSRDGPWERGSKSGVRDILPRSYEASISAASDGLPPEGDALKMASPSLRNCRWASTEAC